MEQQFLSLQSIEKYNSELGAVFQCQKTPATVRCPHSCKVVTEYVMNFLLLLLQVKHTQKRKKKKKITQNKSMNKKEKNSEFTHLHGNTYKY